MFAFFSWCWRAVTALASALFRGALRGAEAAAEVWVVQRFTGASSGSWAA